MDIAPHRDATHNIVASMRFPGPSYYEVLQWLHEGLKPGSYFEIGVCRGESLRLAMPPTIAVGIDPMPEVDQCWRTKTHIVPMASADFFARHRLREFFGADLFSLAFVDGSHHFEQVIDDIFQLESFAGPESIIAVHDTIPLDEKTAARRRCTNFYTGDVWKVVPFLKKYRPDLDLVTILTAPSGLTLIRRLNCCRTRSPVEMKAIREFQELPWEHYKQHRHEFLETIKNARNDVEGWLSHRS